MIMTSKRKLIPFVLMGIILGGGIIGGITVLQDLGVLPGNLLKGTLVVLVHDPPNFPSGVSAVYLSYSELSIRSSSNPHHWIALNQSGTLDLVSIVNFTRTVASVKLPFGTFDELGMNVSSAIITYHGKNYTSLVEQGNFVAQIPSGLRIDQEHLNAGTLFDISPTVIVHGGSTSPSFVLVPAASVFLVPDELLQLFAQVGSEENSTTESWLANDEMLYNQSLLSITVETMTNSSLTISVANSGNSSSMIESFFITLNDTFSGTDGLSTDNSSLVFGVLSNGTLVPLLPDQAVSDLEAQYDVGYNLTSGAVANFTYFGPIPPSGSLSNSSIYSAQDNVTSISTNETIVENTTAESTSSNASIADSLAIAWSGLQIVPGDTYVIGVVTADQVALTTYTALPEV
jgi:hypothetical protein